MGRQQPAGLVSVSLTVSVKVTTRAADLVQLKVATLLQLCVGLLKLSGPWISEIGL
jgi:hypothetical protein